MLFQNWLCVKHNRYLALIPFQGRWHLTTIPVEPGYLWDFVLLKLKTCSLHHENPYIQKFKVISSQVLNNFFSGRFRFIWYEIHECYLTTIPVELGFLWDFVLLQLKTCSLYHENLIQCSVHPKAPVLLIKKWPTPSRCV